MNAPGRPGPIAPTVLGAPGRGPQPVAQRRHDARLPPDNRADRVGEPAAEHHQRLPRPEAHRDCAPPGPGADRRDPLRQTPRVAHQDPPLTPGARGVGQAGDHGQIAVVPIPVDPEPVARARVVEVPASLPGRRQGHPGHPAQEAQRAPAVVEGPLGRPPGRPEEPAGRRPARVGDREPALLRAREALARLGPQAPPCRAGRPSLGDRQPALTHERGAADAGRDGREPRRRPAGRRRRWRPPVVAPAARSAW